MSKGVAGRSERVWSRVCRRAGSCVRVGGSERISRRSRLARPAARRAATTIDHNRNLQKRTGKGYEIAFVTLLALAILFWILYSLLPRAETAQQQRTKSRIWRPRIRISLLTLTG